MADLKLAEFIVAHLVFFLYTGEAFSLWASDFHASKAPIDVDTVKR